MPLPVGTRIAHYEVVAAIGAGGMGEVYRARDARLGRDVAIKVLPATFAADADRLQRFEQEARAAAALNHPNILAVHDVGQYEGIPFIVSELLEGQTLRDRLRAGALPVRRAIDYAIQIAHGLAAAHEKGIVHRDLKPENVFVTDEGRVKILDFGLAKLTQAEAALSGMSMAPTVVPDTVPGVVLGTLGYMAPEQVRGLAADHRTDIFAFGVILYEMLTGQRAFSRETTADTMTAVLKEDLPDVATADRPVPPMLERIVDRCVEKSPSSRFQSSKDLGFALEALSSQSGAAAAVDAGRRIPSREKLAWAAAAGLALTGAAALAYAGYAGWRIGANPPVRAAATYEVALPPGQPLSFLGRHLLAMSPLGTHIVYVANAQLYLRPTGQLDAVPIRGTEEGRGPFFSPDGQWIGFWSRGSIRKVAVTGGAPVEITRAVNPWGATWGSDNRIVFSQGPDGVWVVPEQGGTPTQIIKLEAGETAQSPQMLPDGRVLFTLLRGDNWDEARIVVQQVQTGERRELVQGTDGRYVSTGHIVYGLAGTLFAVPFNPSTLAMSSGPVSLLEGVGQALNALSGAVQMAMSNDGTLAYVPADAVSARGQQRNLVWVDRTGGREQAIPAPPRVYVSPRLSPDGRRIAVDIRDQENDVWVWELTGGTLHQVTFGADLDMYPVWADNNSVIYSSGPSPIAQLPRALFRRRVDGIGEAEELTRAKTGVFPNSMTPDSRVLVRQVAVGAPGSVAVSALMLLPIAGERSARPLFEPNRFNELNAEVSPDGSLVAYQSDESGADEIWVRSYPNTKTLKRRVTYNGGTRPAWAHSGRELFYVSNTALMSIPVTSGPTFGNPQLVFAGKYFLATGSGNLGVLGGAVGRTYDISHDDRRLLMLKDVPPDPAAPAPRARLVVIEGWFDQLRKRVP